MKQKNPTPKNFILKVVLSMLLLLLVILFQVPAEAQYRYRKDVKKEQYEKSFDRWEKDQPKVRLKAVKFAVEQSKETNRTKKKPVRLNKKINRIRKRIK